VEFGEVLQIVMSHYLVVKASIIVVVYYLAIVTTITIMILIITIIMALFNIQAQVMIRTSAMIQLIQITTEIMETELMMRHFLTIINIDQQSLLFI
jgi:hypothetical protein